MTRPALIVLLALYAPVVFPAYCSNFVCFDDIESYCLYRTIQSGILLTGLRSQCIDPSSGYVENAYLYYSDLTPLRPFNPFPNHLVSTFLYGELIE